jgi:prostaglandin-H2 D-isomerase / glutathione transferase
MDDDPTAAVDVKVVPAIPNNMIKLTYFDIEGRGEPVRLALVLAKVPFEDVRVQFDDWAALKPQTPTGQLPVLQVGEDGPMRTQSLAMLRWIGATYSTTLYPPDKLYEIEEALGVVEDLDRAFIIPRAVGMHPCELGYPVGYEKTPDGQDLIQRLRGTFIDECLPKFLVLLTKMMQSHNDGPFLVAGREPTIADCVAIPLLRGFTRGFIDYIPITCLDSHPAIVEYVKSFCALEPIQGRYNNGIH